MTSAVITRVIYGLVIAGLLIAGGYVFEFGLMRAQCGPRSHWVRYGREVVDESNFFGPGTEKLGAPASFLVGADAPSLYRLSSDTNEHIIRMTHWGMSAEGMSVTVLTIIAMTDKSFKARVQLTVFDRNHDKDQSAFRTIADKTWQLNQTDSTRLSRLLSALDAWNGCRDLESWQDINHPSVFIVEEAAGGRYRLLVQDLFVTEEADPWYRRSYKLFGDLTEGTRALLMQYRQENRR